MKKALIAIVAVILIATGIFAYLKVIDQPLKVEEIIPEQPLVFIKMNNVKEAVDYLKSSKFWAVLHSINYDKITAINKNLIIPQQLLKQIFEQMSSPDSQLIFDNFLSQEIAVSVYPVKLDYIDITAMNPIDLINVLNDVASNVLIVTRIKPEAKVAELFAGTFAKSKNVEIKKEEYEKQIINSIQIQGTNLFISYVRIKDLLIFGLGDKTVKRSIDVYNHKDIALTYDKNYNEASKRYLPGANVESYVNIFKVLYAVDELIAGKLPSGNADEWNVVFDSFKGLTSFNLSAAINEKARIKYSISFQKEELNKDVAAFYLCEESDNESLAMIPSEALGYMWMNCLDPKYYWEKMNGELSNLPEDKAQASFAQMQAIESILGLSIEKELIPSLGDEFGGYLLDVDLTGDFPLPKLALFAEINNKEVFNKVLAKLTNNPMVVLQKEEYSGTEINYVSIPVSQDLKPAYAYIGKYFVLSADLDLLKKSLDVLNKKSPGLKEEAFFKSVDDGLSAKNRLTQYVKLDLLLERFKKIVGWSNDLADKKEKERRAFISGSQKRVSDMTDTIAQAKEDIEGLRQKEADFKKEEEGLIAQGLPTDELKARLAVNAEGIASREKEVAALIEQRDGIDKDIREYENKAMPITSEQRRIYIDEVINPVFDALGSIKAFGAKVNTVENSFDTTAIFNIQN